MLRNLIKRYCVHTFMINHNFVITQLRNLALHNLALTFLCICVIKSKCVTFLNKTELIKNVIVCTHLRN